MMGGGNRGFPGNSRPIRSGEFCHGEPLGEWQGDDVEADAGATPTSATGPNVAVNPTENIG